MGLAARLLALSFFTLSALRNKIFTKSSIHEIIRRLFLFVPVLTASLLAGERYALVIGNGAYQHGTVLPNPAQDATLVSGALRAAGFEVIAKADLGLEGLRGALADFQKKVRAGNPEAVAFYYAGHGMEREGSNYLVPVDAHVTDEFQIPTRTYPLTEVLGALDQTKSPLKIVILDCCRNNPLGRSYRSYSRDGGGGLAALTGTPEGTVIAYATSPGKTALDGEGANSPFAKALANALGENGLTVEVSSSGPSGK